jgi:hypothetical protein
MQLNLYDRESLSVSGLVRPPPMPAMDRLTDDMLSVGLTRYPGAKP